MSTSPIFVAIDTADLGRAVDIARAVAPHVGGIKIGLEFFLAHGRAGVAAINEIGLPLFIDLKLHDIPNTVAGAVRSLAAFDPAVITVHADGGREMMAAAKAAAPASVKVVAVTVLTSLGDDDLAEIGYAERAALQAPRLARLARSAGLDGIVCSGLEIAGIHAEWPDGYFVVPGIRPAGSAVDDQKSMATPEAALAAGASMLVIGRPITTAASPAAAAAAIGASLR